MREGEAPAEPELRQSSQPRPICLGEAEAPAEPELHHNLLLRLGGSLALPFFTGPVRIAAGSGCCGDEHPLHCWSYR